MRDWLTAGLAVLLLICVSNGKAEGILVEDKNYPVYLHAVCVELKEDEKECKETLGILLLEMKTATNDRIAEILDKLSFYRGWIRGTRWKECRI